MVTSDLIPWHHLFSSFSDPDCLQLVILFQSDLPTHTHTHTHMKLISTLISMDVTTATKLFWRSSKMLGDGLQNVCSTTLYT
jgi:uncharacterized membrane protein